MKLDTRKHVNSNETIQSIVNPVFHFPIFNMRVCWPLVKCCTRAQSKVRHPRFSTVKAFYFSATAPPSPPSLVEVSIWSNSSQGLTPCASFGASLRNVWIIRAPTPLAASPHGHRTTRGVCGPISIGVCSLLGALIFIQRDQPGLPGDVFNAK